MNQRSILFLLLDGRPCICEKPNYKGKRRRSTEGAQGTNKAHENGEAMGFVGVRLTDQLGHIFSLARWSAHLAEPHALEIALGL